jgi:hypothetical protein
MYRKLIISLTFVFGVAVTCGAAAAAAYDVPADLWTYIYTGDAANGGGGYSALDGTWSHDNGSDQWDETAIGQGRPGGVSALTEGNTTYARLQETGDPRDHGRADPGSNRKIFFGHSITNDIGAAGSTILDDGVTIWFRARVATSGLFDDLHPAGGGATSPWPVDGDGYVGHDGGKDNFGVRQSDGDQVVSFALSLASDDDELPANGLTMNKLNGTSPTADVDLQDDDPGTVNILEIEDMTVWHEFWITVEADPTGTGTHLVQVYMDGSVEPAEFYVTAGDGDDYDDSYISLGVGATPQSGAIDVDFFAYVPGAMGPGDIGKAGNVTPPDGATDVVAPLLQWTAGAGAQGHNLYFGTNPAPGDAEFIGPQPKNLTMYWHQPGLTPGTTYYWRIDEVQADGTVVVGDVWSFSTPPATAYDPVPCDGMKWIETDAELTWAPGFDASSHDVYFGTDETAVADGAGGTFKGNQGNDSYIPDALAPDTTYYWRVDEIDTSDTKHTGQVWSFTTLGTVPAGAGLKAEYYIWSGTGPPAQAVAFSTLQLTRIDPTVDFNWGDPGSPDASLGENNFAARWTGEIETPVTTGYTFSTNTDDGVRVWVDNQLIIENWTDHSATVNTSDPIELSAGRHSIRMEYYENTGGAVAQLYWESPCFEREIIPAIALSPPLRASAPTPPNGAVDVTQAPTLGWDAGSKAVQHDVHFGMDEDAVANATTTTTGVYRGRQSAASYSPGTLQWDTTYYWRIDEVNNLNPDSPWVGSVWSFTTADFVIVDDFEDYNDFTPDRVWQTWRDGYGYSEPPPGYAGNGTGSQVGNDDSPFTEQTIVHSGLQAMTFRYTNDGSTGKAMYSETEREWAVPQNWTQNGVKALTLWFYGNAANSAERLYVGVQDSLGTRKDVPHENINAVLSDSWQECNISLQEFANAGVNLTSIKKMYIGVGNRLAPQMGGTGTLYFDDIRLYQPRCVPSEAKPAASLNNDCVVDHLDVEVMAADWLVEAVAPTDTGLVLHYEFENNVLDSSGNAIHGTPQGSPAYISGVLGQAISLSPADGNDYADCGNPAALNFGTVDWSICAWVKTTQAGATATVFANGGDNTGGIRYTLGIGEGGPDGVVTLTTDDDVDKRQAISSTTVNDDQWHHVVGLRSGTAIRVYVDGVLDGTDTLPAGYDLSGVSQHNAYVGIITDHRDATGQTLEKPFVGLIDDLRIYNYALSQQEVLYLAGSPADLNGDTKVDFKDYALLADSWLEELLWP